MRTVPSMATRTNRRTKIIEAATKLFLARGFHAVGIDEIGAAAGISGPGVYRHFASKDDLLVAVFESATDDLWRDDSAPQSLAGCVRSHVDYAIEHADAIELWYQEGRHLPTTARTRQRRIQRRYIEGWAAALREVDGQLTAVETDFRVRAAIGLIHSGARLDRNLDVGRLREVLERMALAALRA
jgi:AcrR family transcriptional regulator